METEPQGVRNLAQTDQPLFATQTETFFERGVNPTVTAAIEARIDNSVERTYDVTVAEDVLTHFLKGGGNAPGVKRYEVIRGDWSHAGSARIVTFDNGLQAREEVTHLIRPHYFAYQLTDFTDDMGEMVDTAFAQFVFEPLGSRTRVRWQYAFRPLDGRMDAVRAFVEDGWVDWMHGYVDALGEAIARDPFGQ